MKILIDIQSQDIIREGEPKIRTYSFEGDNGTEEAILISVEDAVITLWPAAEIAKALAEAHEEPISKPD